MAPQCERPACAEPATVAYGFDPSRGVAWLAPLDGEGPQQGRLCRRHAEAMVVPRGWWLDDRRAAEQLFQPPATTTSSGARTRRPWRSRRPEERAPAPLAESAVPVGPDLAAVTPAVTAPEMGLDGPGPMAWTPAFVADDDLDGVLNATSPLLSRAFGRVKGSGTRARPSA